MIRPFKAEEDLPNSNPTVPAGNGPLKSVGISCTPICGVNTTRVVHRRSNPADPGVALLGISERPV